MYLDEEGERERKGGREGRKEGSREAGGGENPMKMKSFTEKSKTGFQEGMPMDQADRLG